MFVRTPRLTLRPGWREDAPALARAIADPRIVTMLSRAPWPYGLSDAQAFLALPERRGEPRFVICQHIGDRTEIIGGIGVDRDEAGERELGYWLAPHAWGRGLMTEAARAVVRTLAESLHVERLVAGHFPDNPASGRVLEKAGFIRTGETRARPSVARGAVVPCIMYARSPDLPCARAIAA